MRPYVEHLQALLPPGDLWPRGARAKLTALLSAVAGELSRVDDRAADLRREADIRAASEILSDFERVLGPDPCGRDRGALSLADRQRIAHQRWTARGGQSRAYFRDLAAKLGEHIEIVEYWPSDAGVLQAGGDVVGDGEQFVWTVFLALIGEEPFNAGDEAGAPLGRLLLSDIECEIRRLAPAHTTVVFSYNLLAEPDPARRSTHLIDFAADHAQILLPRRQPVIEKASDVLPAARTWPATFFGADRRLKVAGPRELRIDHNPFTGEALGLLDEPAATNGLWPSNDLSGARWTKAAATVRASGLTLAPYEIVSTGVNFARAQQSVAAPAGHATFSVILRAGTTNFYHATIEAGPSRFYGDLTTGQRTQTNNATTVGHHLTPLGDGYWLAEFVVNLSSASTTPVFVGPAGTLGSTLAANEHSIAAGHLQFEAGSRATSRIPTETGPATRSAERLRVPLPDRPHDVVLTTAAGDVVSIGGIANLYETPIDAPARHVRRLVAYGA